jgi:hypothetical protein
VSSRHLAASTSGTTLADPIVVLSPSRYASLQHDCGKQRILRLLNLEDTPLEHPAPSRLRDREAFTPEPATLLHDRQRLQSKACILTRLMMLIAAVTLAAAVLFHSPSDFRMGLCITVSVAATTLAVRSLFTGKLVWTLLFLGVLGVVFTPFHRTQFSHLLISILDMAALALLAASPLILGKSTSPLVLKHPTKKVVITRY